MLVWGVWIFLEIRIGKFVLELGAAPVVLLYLEGSCVHRSQNGIKKRACNQNDLITLLSCMLLIPYVAVPLL
jgi:hypothetical protein